MLIPKVEQFDSFSKFRPITLRVVAYKIFLKILASRLTLVLSSLMSKEQGASVRGRGIYENIFMAQEMVHYLYKNYRG